MSAGLGVCVICSLSAAAGTIGWGETSSKASHCKRAAVNAGRQKTRDEGQSKSARGNNELNDGLINEWQSSSRLEEPSPKPLRVAYLLLFQKTGVLCCDRLFCIYFVFSDFFLFGKGLIKVNDNTDGDDEGGLSLYLLYLVCGRNERYFAVVIKTKYKMGLIFICNY